MNRKLLLLIISIFIMPLFVFAKEKKEVVLKSVQLIDQSTNVTEVDSVELVDGKINTNLIFQDIGDNITYQIIVENNSDIHYAIDGIIDNNENPSIQYDYTYSDTDFDSGTEYPIFLKITYQEEIPYDSVLEDASYHLNDEIKIQLKLYDVNAIDLVDIINPSTNSNAFIIYFIILFAFISLFIVVKKKKELFLLLLFILTTISLPVNAKQIIPFEIEFNNQLEIPIHFFRSDWNTLVGSDYTKMSIIKTNEIPNDAVDISEKEDGSVKAWISDDTLYFGTPYRMYTPIDSSNLMNKKRDINELNIEDNSISSLFTTNFYYMFFNLYNLEELNTSWLRTDNAINEKYMFQSLYRLKKIELDGFVNVNINSIYELIGSCNSLEEINFTNWDNHRLEGEFVFGYFQSSYLKKVDLTGFDIFSLSSLKDFFNSFGGGNATLYLYDWDYSNIINMESMFQYSYFKNIVFGDINSSKVENISKMFWNAYDLESIHWDSFDTSSVIDASEMFYYCNALEEIDLSNLDFSNLKNADSMFSYTRNLKKLIWNDSNTEKLENITNLFLSSGVSKLDFSNLDFGSVKKAVRAFSSESIEEIVLPKVMPRSSNIVIKLSNFFIDDSNNEYNQIDRNISAKTKLVKNYNIAKFLDGLAFNVKLKKLAGMLNPSNTSQNTNITAIMRSSTTPNINSMTEDNIISIENGIPIYAWFDNGIIYYYSSQDTIYFNMNCSYMFQDFRNVTSIDLNSINASQVVFFDYSFEHTGRNATSFSMNLSNWDISQVYTMYSMFYNTGRNATTWNIGDLSSWNTSEVIEMSYIFYYAGYSATTFNLGNLSDWNTSLVTDFSDMFNHAGYSATVWNIGDLSNWDTSKVTRMGDMFNNAGHNATTWNIGDLSNWDTSQVKTFYEMFSSAGRKATTWNIGDISNWDTSKVTNMSYMFQEAGYNVTTWNIGDLSNWDTSEVTNMYAMFLRSGYKATAFNLGNLSNWNTSKVVNMAFMFSETGRSATTWNIGNLSNWDTSQVTNMSCMFADAGNNATTWNSIGTLKVYASNIESMFYYAKTAKATLKIYNKPCDYSDAFYYSATATGSGITVNYTSAVDNINSIIATKSSSSNVTKGSLFTE